MVEARVNELGNRLSCVVISALDAETVAALNRAVQAAAKQLSALGTRLAAVVRRGNADEERVSAHSSVACVFSFDLLIFTSQHGLIDATKALHSCVTLPLECGSALMASADASIGESTEAAYKCLFTQTQLLSGAMSSAMTIGDAEHLAAQLAPPERLLPWLSAAISKLFALHGTLLGRGSSLRLQVMLVQVIYTIGNSKYLAPHAAAVQRDASLQRSLLQLLVPLLHASAAALQLPAERRPAEFHIKSVAQVVYALTAPMLVIPFMERFSPTSAEHSTYAQRVLQSTAQLFVAMPASYPPEAPCAPIPVLWSHMLLLLGSGGVLVKNSIDAHLEQGNTAFSDAQRRNMLQQLQAALSRLPTALHWAVKDEQLHAAAGPDVLLITCGNIGELWMLLVSQELQANLHGGWAEVKVFCAASSALLRALPHASALAGLAATGVATGSQQHFGDKLTKLLVTATLLTLQAIKQVADSGPSSAADSAAAAEALWQLHTTLCRCIHYSAAAPAAGIRFDKLLLSLGYCMQVADMVSSRVCAAPPGSTASHSVAKPRHLPAMSVAQVPATLVVAGACHLPPNDTLVARALLQALKLGPAALALSPSVQQALGQCLDRIEAGEASHSTCLDPALLDVLQQLHQQRCEPQPGDALELAQAAATRSCAYLHCANLAGEGGAAAGQGAGSQRCSKCKVAWYCGTACSHADWRAGHRRMCRALGAARVAEREGEWGEV